MESSVKKTGDRDTIRSVNGDSVRFDDDDTFRNTEMEIQNIISKLSDDVCDNTGDRDIDRLVGDGGHDENQGTDKVEEAITNVSHPKEKVGMSSVSKCVSINESGQENKGIAKLSNDLTSSEKIKRNGITLLKILSPLSKSVHHKHPQCRKMVKIIKSSTEQIERGIKRYQCSECDYYTGYTGAMYRHMRRIHEDFAIEKLTCPGTKTHVLKDLTSKNEIDKNKDMKKAMESDLVSHKHGCESPDLDKVITNNKGQHPVTHKIVKVIKSSKEEIKRGKKRYGCSECGYYCMDTSAMYRHMRRIHKGFVIKKLSEIHTNAHPGIKVIKETMLSETDLSKTDKAIHTTEKGQYPNTSKTVTIIETSEEQITSGKKRYRCSECDYYSSYPSNMYRHMKKIHVGFVTERLNANANTNVQQDLTSIDGFDNDVEKEIGLGLVSHLDGGGSRDLDKVIHMNDKGQHPVGRKTVKVIKSSTEEIKSGKKRYQCSECGFNSERTGNLYKHMKGKHKDFVIKKLTDFDTNASIHPRQKVNKEMMSSGIDLSKMVGKNICSDESEKGAENVNQDSEGLYHSDVSVIGDDGQDMCMGNECDVSVSDVDDENDNDNGQDDTNEIRMDKNESIIRRKHKDWTFVSRCYENEMETDGFDTEGKDTDVDLDMCVSHKDRGQGLTASNVLKINDTGQRPDTCKIVKVIKSSTEEMKRGARRYQCSECGYYTSDTGAMYRHMRRNHKGFVIEKLKGFDTNIHMQNKDFTSIKGFNKEKHIKNNIDVGESLDTDKVIHTNDQCQHPESRKIVKVMKSSTEEMKRGARRYQCSECGYFTSNTGSMYKHMRRHHKGFSIEKLTDYKKLIHHSRQGQGQQIEPRKTVKVIKSSTEEIKKGRKSYRCSECDLNSDKTGNLYSHMQRMHKDFVIERLTDFDTSFHSPGQKVDNRTMSLGFSVSKRNKNSVSTKESEKCAEDCNDACMGNEDRGSGLEGDKNRLGEDENCLGERFIGSTGSCNIWVADTSNKKRYCYRCSLCHMTSPYSGFMYKHIRKHKDWTFVSRCYENEMETDGFDTGKGKDTDVDLDMCVSHKDRGQGLTASNVLHFNDTCQFPNTNKTGELEESSTEQIERDKKRYECSVCCYSSNYRNVFKHMRIVHKDFVNKKLMKRKKDLAVNSSYSNKMEAFDKNIDNEMKAGVDVSVCRQVGGESLNCDKVTLMNGISQQSDSRKIVKVVKRSKEEIKKGKRRYQCSECGYYTSDTGAMYRHMRRNHKGFVIERLNGTKIMNIRISAPLRTPRFRHRYFGCFKCDLKGFNSDSFCEHTDGSHNSSVTGNC